MATVDDRAVPPSDDEDTHALCAIRHGDGSVSLYVDEAYALERGVDPSQLVHVPIPRTLYAEGTVQQIREYVATVLEARDARGS